MLEMIEDIEATTSKVCNSLSHEELKESQQQFVDSLLQVCVCVCVDEREIEGERERERDLQSINIHHLSGHKGENKKIIITYTRNERQNVQGRVIYQTPPIFHIFL